MDLDEVLHELVKEKGKHFEPCIVDTVVKLRSQIEQFMLEESNKEE